MTLPPACAPTATASVPDACNRCPRCGGRFALNRSGTAQIYCSPACRKSAWQERNPRLPAEMVELAGRLAAMVAKAAE